MFRIATIATLVGAALLVVSGCERKPATDETTAPAEHTARTTHAPNHAAALTDTAADEDVLDESVDRNDPLNEDAATANDHAMPEPTDDAEEDHLRGAAHELGSTTVGDLTLTVTQIGVASADTIELVFEIGVEGEPVPDAIRLLVRNADGDESLKVKAHDVGNGKYDAHVGDLPAFRGEGAVVVVETETADGTQSAEFPLKS